MSSEGFQGLKEISRKLLSLPEKNPILACAMGYVMDAAFARGYRLQEFEQRDLEYPDKYYADKVRICIADSAAVYKAQVASLSLGDDAGFLEMTIWTPDSSRVFRSIREGETAEGNPIQINDSISFIENGQEKPFEETYRFLEKIMRMKPNEDMTKTEFEILRQRYSDTRNFRLRRMAA